LDLWNAPNPFYTRLELVETVQQHIDLAGVGYLLVVRNGGLPVELWFARPDRMSAVPSVKDFLAGWIYKTPDGEKVPFGVDEVIPIRKPNPLDPYSGSSAVAAVGTDLDAGAYAAQWNRNFFRNSAEPGGIIQIDRRLDDDQFNELRMRWNEQHRGVANAHRVAILEQGQWVDRKMTQRDMQFAELRDASRDVIMEAFRVSKTTLGISDDVNLANAKAAEYQFSAHLTVPRLRRWHEALNYRLLPMFGSTAKSVEFDFESPVREEEADENAERDSKVNAVVKLLAVPGVKFDVKAMLEAYDLPDVPFEEVEPPPALAPGTPGQPPGSPAEQMGDEEKNPPSDNFTNRWRIVDTTVLDRMEDLDWGLFGGHT
jgi:HK97 family phage portal protein